MNSTAGSPSPLPSRRQFLQTSGRFAAASALAGVVLPHVHAAERNTIQLALIGCGGRGAGAVANAMSAGGLVLGDLSGRQAAPGEQPLGPVKLVAMADIRPDRLNGTHTTLKETLGAAVDVPPERRFLGFDAYRKAIDCLRPGDVALLTTFSSFRAQHFEYAVERGVNVFMEKTFGPDPGSIQRLLRASEKAEQKNLKVGCGLMCRHSSARQAMINQIRDGRIGDILNIRAYRMDPGYFLPPFARNQNELLWQLSPGHPYQFMWSSGGIFLELMIHQMDEVFWLKDGWPVAAHGVGGRFAGSTDASQNLDSYSVEYTFADGSKLFFYGRCMEGCNDAFASYAHGSKGLAVISSNSHWPSSARIYKSQKMTNADIAWRAPKEGPELDPYQVEWQDLVDAIRNNTPYNEVKRSVQASLTCVLGRKAAHTGQKITYDEIWNGTEELAPNVENLTADGPAPVMPDADGRYPVPQPGLKKNTEY